MKRGLLTATMLASGTWLAAGLGGPATAQAAITPDANLYCSAGGNPATNSDTSGFNLSTGDIDLTIDPTTYTAADCYGAFQRTPGASGETDDLNAIWQGSGDPFTLVGKSDDGPSSGSLLGGVDFDVTAQETTSGTWTVSWTDSGGNLPFTVDFAAMLKAGGPGNPNSGGVDAASYLLEDVLIPIDPSSGNGTFNIAFTNPGGEIPDLSHLALAARIVDDNGNGNGNGVPVPGTILLLGAGLAGLGVATRARVRARSGA